MPETHHHSEDGIENKEQTELQRRYERRLQEVRIHLGRLFDDCKSKGADPIDEIMKDDQTLMRKAYGDARIDELFGALRQIPQDDREAFCDQMMGAAHFLFYDRYFDPEIKQLLDAEDQARREQKNIEDIRFGSLLGKIHEPDAAWHVELPNKQYIEQSDRVLEVSWPDVESPKGIQDIKESFHEMAKYIEEHLEIKAVVAVSWMMSRNVARKLGFTQYPDVPVEEEQIESILKFVDGARKDKPKSDKEVTRKDVMFGAIDRDEFIQRFGSR